MSFRDAHAMCECLFYVNDLPGGEGHHDGGMKGRDEAAVLASPMLRLGAEESAAIERLRAAAAARGGDRRAAAEGNAEPRCWTPRTSRASRCPAPAPWRRRAWAPRRPTSRSPGSTRSSCFFVSCDLNPSTKLGKAAGRVPRDHRFEMSIQEQAATLMTDGLSFSSREPQLNVFATFAAFIEGIAREGFEIWRYQRNLTGANEGLNVLMHLSHVGACTGRDHFSGWSLDWINLALGYLPYLRRFYAPADARAAFVAVRDAAAG